MAKPEKSLFPDEDLPCKKFKTKGGCIPEQSGSNISVKNGRKIHSKNKAIYRGVNRGENKS